MSGFLPNEGETLVANVVFKNTDDDRGTDTYLGLFTNASVSETTAFTSLTQPTGGGYAEILLTDASWTVTNDVASYAKQTFNVTGGDYNLPIYGYYVRTNGTIKRLLVLEVDPAPGAPYTMLENDAYDVTINVTVA